VDVFKIAEGGYWTPLVKDLSWLVKKNLITIKEIATLEKN
jgi:hypothetical protein